MSERSKMQVCMYVCVYFQQFVPCHVATGWWRRGGQNSRRCARRWEWGSCQRSFDTSRPQQLQPPLPPPPPPPYRRNKWMWRSTSRSPSMRSQSMSLRGEDIVLQVWELRHCPQKIQGGHGFPYKGRAHKEGPTVLLLCL